MKRKNTFKILLLILLILVSFSSVNATVNALEVSHSVEAYCSSGKAVIRASLTNNESGSRYTYVVIPTDRQTELLGDAKTVNPGASESWEIQTNQATLNRGTVHFDIQRVEDADSKIFRLATYDPVDCTTNPNTGTVQRTEVAETQPTGLFELNHSVRIKGNSTWLDKVANVNKGNEVEFLVQITNKSSETQNTEIVLEVPTELSVTSGATTVKVDNLAPSQRKDVFLTAQLRPSVAGEKCVVSKAQANQNGTRLTSDLATVCYGSAVTTLPTTGPVENMIMMVLGTSMLASGLLMKRFPSLAEVIVG